ncbi:GATA zinc finger domain-containing protein 4-like [Yasminevirus sp. GU-2018]|uniref:GATA zinc finger domain-containing protein 4-like n=1 Tax=Yasminevirus sp. GU-2018 TaxID=2420051 RepID=A0A5K0UA53_9VIRU|nr:GATA zinc finger domain-containing protein 4-like [Yasminevirus sp. GU-2018]
MTVFVTYIYTINGLIKIFLFDIYIMNNLSNSMGEYNKNIDSIGTEISYSSSEAPALTGGAKSKGSFSSSGARQNQNITIQSQNGGKFLNFLFGGETSSEKSQTLTSTEMTELVMRAIESGRYQAADFLLEQRFIPDMEYVNAKKENLINALVKARTNMQNADKALAQLIPKAKDALNVPDANGMTAFFNAVSRGFGDVAQFMEKYGAKRIAPSSDQRIVSEYDVSDKDTESAIYESQNGRPVAIEVVKAPAGSQKPSIFAKPEGSPASRMTQQVSIPDLSGDDTIAGIVKAFKTRSTASESDGSQIVRTDAEVEPRPARTPHAQQVNLNEQIRIMKELMAKTGQKADESIRKITTRSQPPVGFVSQPQGDTIGESIVQQPIAVKNPTADIDSNADSEVFVEALAEKLVGRSPTSSFPQNAQMQQVAPINPVNPVSFDQQMPVSNLAPINADMLAQQMQSANYASGQLVGGARGKATKTGSKTGSTTKKTTSKVVGKRQMVGFSELSDNYDMFGGMSDNEMRRISRASTNQKNKFHEEAVEKILAHLSKKDPMTAKAVKAIIYDEVKQANKEASGLDRAALLLKAITKEKVDKVLQQKDMIKKIVDYLEQKNAEKESSKDSDKKPASKKVMKRAEPDFESSIEETSDYDSSNYSSTSVEQTGGSKKSKHTSKKTSTLFKYQDF